jgi:hypothetical protein
MIISDEHRYLFVELHHTASTAISAELRANYGGREILHKHARYHEFLRVATPEQRKYFVFGGIRHPMDETVSMYFKYLKNHEGAFTNPALFEEHGGWVTLRHRERFEFIQREHADFPTYFRRFYWRPYDNWSNLAHRRFDFLLRFEALGHGFAELIGKIGLTLTRPLPAANKTSGRERSWEAYYTADIQDQAIRVFGPFMRHWDYEFPASWGAVRVPLSSYAKFHGRRLLRAPRNWQRHR